MKRPLVLSLAVVFALIIVLPSAFSADEADEAGAKAVLPSYQKLTKDIDASIQRGIRYFEKTIHKDGHFGVEVESPSGEEGKFLYVDDVGVTGLVVLSILESPYGGEESKKEYFKKAVKYLENNVLEDGAIANKGMGYYTYKTAICLRVFTLLDKEKYAKVIKNGQDFLCKIQYDEDDEMDEEDNYFGGWGYGQKFGRASMPPAEWAIEGLRESGLSPDDNPVFKKALIYMSKCQNLTQTNKFDQAHPEVIPINDGGVRHSVTGSKVEIDAPDDKLLMPSYGSMTAAFIKSLLYAGVSKDDIRLQAAFNWILKNYSFEKNPGFPTKTDKNADKQGLYYYYHTISKALLLYGAHVVETPDGEIHNWAVELATKVLSLQRKDDSWINEFEERWFEGNPSLVTAYSLLALANCQKEMESQKVFVEKAEDEIAGCLERLTEIPLLKAQGEIDKEEADNLTRELSERIVILTQSLNQIKSTIRFE